MLLFVIWTLLNLALIVSGHSIYEVDDIQSEIPSEVKPPEASLEAKTLECRPREFTYRAIQLDENGKQCNDTLTVNACWGRCDSNEIADWRFPYKKSNHPVCVHYGRDRSVVILRYCEAGTLPGTELYEYLEAAECKCQQCSSSDTSCEGQRYNNHRSSPDSLGLGFRFPNQIIN